MKSLKMYSVFLLLGVLLIGLLFPMKAMAAEFDPTKTVEFTIHFAEGDEPFAGVEFRLYRVADVREDGSLTFVDVYENSGINLEVTDDAGWLENVTAMETFMAENTPEANAVATTDENGTASFEALPAGFYFVQGDNYINYENGDGWATPVPFFISLPNGDINDEWQYHVGVNCKYTVHYLVEKDIEVQKVWSGDVEEDRPSSVVVELYADGELFDTVTLDKENHWKHTWFHLNGRKKYTVKEKEVPTGYEDRVEQQGDRFVVINEWGTEEETEEDEPGGSPVSPGQSGQAGGQTTGTSKLPQTGVLWWPVPVLLVAGILLILAGVFRRRGQVDEE